MKFRILLISIAVLALQLPIPFAAGSEAVHEPVTPLRTSPPTAPPPPAKVLVPVQRPNLSAAEGYDALELIFDFFANGKTGAVDAIMDADENSDRETRDANAWSAMFQATSPTPSAGFDPVPPELVPVVGDLGGPVDEIF